MVQAISKVRLNIYVHVYRKHRLMVYLFHDLLLTTAILAGICRDKNSTSRPSLWTIHQVLPPIHCKSLSVWVYQFHDLIDIPHSLVLQIFSFFKTDVTVSFEIPNTRPVSRVPAPFIAISTIFSCTPGRHALFLYSI